MAEVRQFRLPDVGEGLTEADIVTWRVKPGDPVQVNQVIVEIETAKSLVELPSPYEGVVSSLLVAEGDTVDVGAPIIEVDVAADAAADTATAGTPAGQAGPADNAPPADAGTADIPAGRADTTDDAPSADKTPSGTSPAASPAAGVAPEEAAREPGIHGSPAPKIERQAVLVGYGVKLGTTTRRPRKEGGARSGSRAGQVPAEPVRPAAAPGGNGAAALVRPAAKPPVRKLARDLGVDLAALTGTGPDGTITREDVLAAAEPAAQPSAPVAAGKPVAAREPVAASAPVAAGKPVAAGAEERIRVRGVRKATAAAVTASAFTAPHVTEFLQIDITETMRAVQRLRDLPEFNEVPVRPLLLVAKALILAVARHPMINSSWDERAQEIVVKHYVNLGIAAATNRGLIVPNIKNAQALSLPELAGALGKLASTAREGKATPADLSGGTITITNVGVFGVDAGTPILTPGEAAILALSQIREMPWVHEGAVAVRQVTTLALSFDHRIVDGSLGSAFLRDVGTMLTDPLHMLAWS